MQLFAGKALDEETRVGLRTDGEGMRGWRDRGWRDRGKGVGDGGGRNKTALVEFSRGRFMAVAYRT